MAQQDASIARGCRQIHWLVFKWQPFQIWGYKYIIEPFATMWELYRCSNILPLAHYSTHNCTTIKSVEGRQKNEKSNILSLARSLSNSSSFSFENGIFKLLRQYFTTFLHILRFLYAAAPPATATGKPLQNTCLFSNSITPNQFSQTLLLRHKQASFSANFGKFYMF